MLMFRTWQWTTQPPQRASPPRPRRGRYHKGPLDTHQRRTCAFAGLWLEVSQDAISSTKKKGKPYWRRVPIATQTPSRFIVSAAKCPFKGDGPSSNKRPTSFAAPLSLSNTDPRAHRRDRHGICPQPYVKCPCAMPFENVCCMCEWPPFHL
jgi:hypothetical protein